MVGRRLRGKQSVEPSRPIDRNGWCLSQILRIFEWLVEYLGLQIFRLLPVAKNCRELLDTNQSNMWTRLLKDKICFNHFRAPDVMCQALSSRIPADLHNLSVCNGTCAIQRASKRSIANSWRLVVDWVRPSLKKLEMEFGQGVLSMSPQKLFFEILICAFLHDTYIYYTCLGFSLGAATRHLFAVLQEAFPELAGQCLGLQRYNWQLTTGWWRFKDGHMLVYFEHTHFNPSYAYIDDFHQHPSFLCWDPGICCQKLLWNWFILTLHFKHKALQSVNNN